MKTVTVTHVESQTRFVKELKRADNFFKRLRGLMFTSSLPVGQGLMITPCQQIHTQFMHYAVDVLFVDEQHKVLHIERGMKPWRFSKFYKQAKYVLEVNAGEAAMVNTGDQLMIG